MDETEACKILDMKCTEPGCWHRSRPGYIYCTCCLYGECTSNYRDDRALYIEATAIIERAQNGQANVTRLI